MKSKWKIIFVVLVIVGSASGLYAWKEFNRSHTDTAKLKAVFTYDAATLLGEFEENEGAANAKLNDNVLAVKGIISKIDFSDSTQTVTLGVEGSLGSVLCQFDSKHKEELASLKMGETITIKGVCTGILMDVILTRCVVDNPL